MAFAVLWEAEISLSICRSFNCPRLRKQGSWFPRLRSTSPGWGIFRKGLQKEKKINVPLWKGGRQNWKPFSLNNWHIPVRCINVLFGWVDVNGHKHFPTAIILQLYVRPNKSPERRATVSASWVDVLISTQGPIVPSCLWSSLLCLAYRSFDSFLFFLCQSTQLRCGD